MLGSVFLVATGAEAIYADLGHFGAPVIRTDLVRRGVPGVAFELPRPGRAAAARSRRRGTPVLPARASPAPDPGAPDRHGRHVHRLAGGDHGGLLAHVAGDPARLPAAPAGAAHLGARARTDLHSGDQLHPLRTDRPRGRGVPHVGEPGGGLRHRGDLDDGRHERVPVFRLAGPAGPRRGRRRRRRGRIPRDRSAVLLGERVEDRARRVVPSGSSPSRSSSS